MTKHLVKCRFCKEQFDAQAKDENILWMQPQPKWYYHIDCYNKWKNKDSQSVQMTDDMWITSIYNLVTHDLHSTYDWFMCDAQIRKFLKSGCKARGIYYAARYAYLIKHIPWQKDKGFGIIPYVYDDSIRYWREQNNKNENLIRSIESQLNNISEPIKIEYTEKKKEKKTYNLEDII